MAVRDSMRKTVPISDRYRGVIFDALALQIVIGFMSLMILDGGVCAQICGAALLSFWGGATVMILRRPKLPTKLDLQLLRFGYFPVLVLAGSLLHFVWH